MSVCLMCDKKLSGERTQVCSSITPYSNVPFPEKIVGMLREDFIIIVDSDEYMCKQCTSVMIHLDKLENELELAKNAFLSVIKVKLGITPVMNLKKMLQEEEHVLAEESSSTKNEIKNEVNEETDIPEKAATSDEGQAAPEQAEGTPAQEENQEIPDNVAKGVGGDLPIGSDENKTGDLDIASRLAAILIDNPPTEGQQNIV